MKKYFALIFAALCLVMAGCSNEEPAINGESSETPNNEAVDKSKEKPDEQPVVPNPFTPIQLTDAEKASVSTCNKFAWRLFAASYSNGTFSNRNAVISPLSVELCLSLMANAAEGGTREAILNPLGISDIDALNSSNAKLVESLCGIDTSTKVSFANSVWHREEIAIKPDFAADLGKYYDAEMKLIYPETVQADVNRWCDEKTCGVIKKFPLDNAEHISAMLLNATYFKGLWATSNKFKKSNTQQAIFNGLDGASSVDFMYINLGDRYYSSESASATRLYFGNGAYSLTLILPDEDKSINDCLAELAENPNALVKRNLYDVTLGVPKFKTEGTFELGLSLADLGLSLSDRDSYQNMTDTPIYLGKLQQVSSFAIDEEGAEAAAETGGVHYENGPDETEPKKIFMMFDRPFIYAITEKSTGAILFLGLTERL